QPIHLYWGARQLHDVYERDLVLGWTHQYPHFRFTAVLSDSTDKTARLGWVHEAVLAEHPDLERYDIYAAGRPGLVEAIRRTFPARGVREEHLLFDSFDYASDPKPLA
ncbi:MAG: hypothetical protein JO042_05230, partial [Sinobacteraceae bacterium]|nr:hypothetical protein [Nevskiaceae bacterium]